MPNPSAPRRLRSAFAVDPIGVDAPPLLSWEPSGTQQAFEVELASGTSPPVVFAQQTTRSSIVPDAPLASARGYRWRVRTLFGGLWSDWSELASFETALLGEGDWRGSAWITSPTPGPAPVFTTVFSVEPGARARLFLAGLGIANAVLNGQAVGKGVLDPPPSAYDTVVFYRTIDLAALVRPGPNVLSITLGRGFFGMTTTTAFNWHIAPWWHEPQLRALVLDMDDPTIPLLVSDDKWSVSTSNVLDDSFYAGEVHDFGAPPATGNAVTSAAPRGRLRSAQQPPVSRRERVDVVGHGWTAPGRQRFDLAQNVAGMLTLTSSDAGSPHLFVKLGEKLDGDGAVLAADPAIPGGLQRSELRSVPAGIPVALDLTYAGFRYVEVAGTTQPVSIEVDRVSAAPASIGSFWCSDDRLNRVHDIARLTLENCLQGTPIDTPLYEKQGYTGDAQLLGETLAYNFWMPQSLNHWLEASVFPSQLPDGSLPGITPTPPGNWIFDTPSPAWDAALFELPEILARHYADLETVRGAMPTLRRYLAYLDERFPSGIVTVGLGDWNAPGYVMPPEPPAVLSTAYFARFLTQMAGFSERLGHTDEADRYGARAAHVRDAFHLAFWSPDGFYRATTGSGGEGVGYRETDNVLALAFDLVPAELRETVAARIERGILERGGHLDTGMVGTRFLLRVLCDAGRSALAFDVARNSGYPGWQYWIDNGATTLYENWELDGRSHNHAMFGSIEEWFYADVAGLQPGSDGWASIRFCPRFPADDQFRCEASVETIAGPISVSWTKAGDTVVASLTAPAGLVLDVPPRAEVAAGGRTTTRLDEFTVRHDLVFSIRPRG